MSKFFSEHLSRRFSVSFLAQPPGRSAFSNVPTVSTDTERKRMGQAPGFRTAEKHDMLLAEPGRPEGST
jgi:hypothetical protein